MTPLLALPLVLAAHELGHAGAAAALGYRPTITVRAWPPGLGIRLRAGRTTLLTPIRCAIFVLAGPAANLLLAAAGVAVLPNLALGLLTLLAPIPGGDGYAAVRALRCLQRSRGFERERLLLR